MYTPWCIEHRADIPGDKFLIVRQRLRFLICLKTFYILGFLKQIHQIMQAPENGVICHIWCVGHLFVGEFMSQFVQHLHSRNNHVTVLISDRHDICHIGNTCEYNKALDQRQFVRFIGFRIFQHDFPCHCGAGIIFKRVCVILLPRVDTYLSALRQCGTCGMMVCDNNRDSLLGSIGNTVMGTYAIICRNDHVNLVALFLCQGDHTVNGASVYAISFFHGRYTNHISKPKYVKRPGQCTR